MKLSEQLLIETAKHTENIPQSKNFYDEYEKFSTQYKELMASGFTKPRESQLRSADAAFGDATLPSLASGCGKR